MLGPSGASVIRTRMAAAHAPMMCSMCSAALISIVSSLSAGAFAGVATVGDTFHFLSLLALHPWPSCTWCFSKNRSSQNANDHQHILMYCLQSCDGFHLCRLARKAPATFASVVQLRGTLPTVFSTRAHCWLSSCRTAPFIVVDSTANAPSSLRWCYEIAGFAGWGWS